MVDKHVELQNCSRTEGVYCLVSNVFHLIKTEIYTIYLGEINYLTFIFNIKILASCLKGE